MEHGKVLKLIGDFLQKSGYSLSALALMDETGVQLGSCLKKS